MNKNIYLGRKFVSGEIWPDEVEAMVVAFAHGLKNPVFSIIDDFKESKCLVLYEKGTSFSRKDVFNDADLDIDSGVICGREIDLMDYNNFKERWRGIFESLKASFGDKEFTMKDIQWDNNVKEIKFDNFSSHYSKSV